MNREILFRGKQIDNGEWVCGNLFKNKNDYYISPEIEPFGESAQYPQNGKPEHFYAFDNFVKIYSETIGQYTGLTDKNGNKIFEGDIVRTQPYSDKPFSKKRKYKQHIGVVEYKVRHFKNSNYKQNYEGEWRVDIKNIGEYNYYDWSDFFKCEVIGNICDNPELLEVLE